MKKLSPHLVPALFLPWCILFTTKHQENFICTSSSPILNSLFNLVQVGLFSLALTFHWNCHGCLRLNLVTNFQGSHYGHSEVLNTLNRFLLKINSCGLCDALLHSVAALFPSASWTPLSLPASLFSKLRFLFLFLFSCPSVHSSRGVHTPQSPPRWVFWLLEWFKTHGVWSLDNIEGTQNSEYKIGFKKVNTYLNKKIMFEKLKKTTVL